MELEERFNKLLNILEKVFEILHYSEEPNKELIRKSLNMINATKELYFEEED